MSNKIQLQENNLNLQYILEQLSSSESSLNLLTQDNTIVGKLTKTSDGYKLNETEDPFGEIETQSPLLAQLVDLVSKKYMIEGNYVWKKYEYNSESSAAGNFIEYVISDASDTYPDGGAQDGYWYEKVVEGIDLPSIVGYTKMAIDTFSFATNTSEAIITHSLGVIPKFGILLSKAPVSNFTRYYAMMEFLLADTTRFGNMGSYYEYYGFSCNGTSAVNSDGLAIPIKNLTVNSVVFENINGGIEYTLITMA